MRFWRPPLCAAVLALAAPGAAVASPVAAGLPPGGLRCAFTTASIDGRAAFDSALAVAAMPLAGRSDLAVLQTGEGAARLAAVTHEGVWLSLRTEPDIDHAYRVMVLDVAQAGPATGHATLVVLHPGSATRIVTREGQCSAARREPPE